MYRLLQSRTTQHDRKGETTPNRVGFQEIWLRVRPWGEPTLDSHVTWIDLTVRSELRNI
jgi:hypothetical protein